MQKKIAKEAAAEKGVRRMVSFQAVQIRLERRWLVGLMVGIESKPVLNILCCDTRDYLTINHGGLIH